MWLETVIFPSDEETKLILNSQTAKKMKDRNTFFECTHVVKNMHLRLVVLQATIDGVDTAQLLITPKDQDVTKVFSFLARNQ